MRTRSKLTLAALAATILMNVAIGSASANRLSFTNPNLFRVTWSALRLFDQEGTDRMTCPITLEGSFHSATISKIRGALIGYVSTASIRGANSAGNCSGGTASVQTTSLPWHITYDSFTGMLPRPTSINISGHITAYRIGIFGVFCLYRENGTQRVRSSVQIEANGLITGDIPLAEAQLPRFEGGFLCPAECGFGSAGTVRALPGGGNVRVTLI